MCKHCLTLHQAEQHTAAGVGTWLDVSSPADPEAKPGSCLKKKNKKIKKIYNLLLFPPHHTAPWNFNTQRRSQSSFSPSKWWLLIPWPLNCCSFLPGIFMYYSVDISSFLQIILSAAKSTGPKVSFFVWTLLFVSYSCKLESCCLWFGCSVALKISEFWYTLNSTLFHEKPNCMCMFTAVYAALRLSTVTVYSLPYLP